VESHCECGLQAQVITTTHWKFSEQTSHLTFANAFIQVCWILRVAPPILRLHFIQVCWILRVAPPILRLHFIQVCWILRVAPSMLRLHFIQVCWILRVAPPILWLHFIQVCWILRVAPPILRLHIPGIVVILTSTALESLYFSHPPRSSYSFFPTPLIKNETPELAKVRDN
jgi:hypothetical protein